MNEGFEPPSWARRIYAAASTVFYGLLFVILFALLTLAAKTVAFYL